MIGHFWIGLGGALGSMGRAWLAVTVARITGPQFPWGAILINITGSFVIGFFGTLTTSGSRFAVPVDVRAASPPSRHSVCKRWNSRAVAVRRKLLAISPSRSCSASWPLRPGTMEPPRVITGIPVPA
jgi:hypothetical protein